MNHISELLLQHRTVKYGLSLQHWIVRAALLCNSIENYQSATANSTWRNEYLTEESKFLMQTYS